MNLYHSFIAGLPEIQYNQRGDFLSAEKLAAMLSELLPREEMEYVEWLWQADSHRTIAAAICNNSVSGQIAPAIHSDHLSVHHESHDLLPAYIQKVIQWKENHKGILAEKTITQKLQQFYFMQLAEAPNIFLNQWATAEMNRLNLLGAVRCEKNSLDKNKELIKGNSYFDLLLEFQVNQKIICTESQASPQILSALSIPDFMEKEKQIDQIRWETIDRIIRFEYFTINNILGYFQKTIILTRWQKLTLNENGIDIAQIAKQMISEKMNQTQTPKV